MNLRTFPSRQTFQEAIITSLHSRMLKAQREGKIFRLAVSGGSTPGPIYEKLAQQSDIDWSLVEIYLVDERYVPHKHEHSNHRLITQTLISKLSSKPKAWVSFDTRLEIDECLEAYEAQLDKGLSPFFDLVLLGMGTDGHTASLFPNVKALKESKHWVAHTQTDENVIKDRLTLTYPALLRSKEIFFLMTGEPKYEVLEKALKANPDSTKIPAAKLLQRPETQIFYGEF